MSASTPVIAAATVVLNASTNTVFWNASAVTPATVLVTSTAMIGVGVGDDVGWAVDTS